MAKTRLRPLVPRKRKGTHLALPAPDNSSTALAKTTDGEVDEQLRAKLKQLSKRPKNLFAITIVTSPDKPPVTLKLGRLSGSLVLLVAVTIVALAVVTLVNLVGGSSPLPNGDNLAYQNSAAVREQERQRAIDLQEQRLASLADESNKRKQEITELENRLKELNTSIEALKGFAKQLQELIGASAGSSSGAPPAGMPVPTIPARGGNPSNYIPPIRLSNGYLDVQQTQSYLNQFNSLVTQLDTFSQLLAGRKQLLNTFNEQLSTYSDDIARQRAAIENSTNTISRQRTDDSQAPNIMPYPGPITSPFGWRMSPFRAGVREFHYGIDIGLPEGTPIQATKSGIVTYIGFDPGYGNRIEISHNDGWLTMYGHNSKIIAKVGQTVNKGDIIALSGNTGASTGPHLHYEIHKNGIPVNPLNYIQVQVRYAN